MRHQKHHASLGVTREHREAMLSNLGASLIKHGRIETTLTKAKARPGRPGEWNTLEITLDGPRTTVTVNGIQVTDHREGDPVPPKAKWHEPNRGPRPEEGFIGLQNHDDGDVVFFKEVSVAPLAR